jgi:hypothetical protein
MRNLAILFCSFVAQEPTEPVQPYVVLKPAKEREARDNPTMALTPGAEPDKDKNPTGKSAEQVQEIKKRSAEWLKTCLGDWDAQTHMSKAEWRTTCQRVSKEREQFLLNTPGAVSIGERNLR